MIDQITKNIFPILGIAVLVLIAIGVNSEKGRFLDSLADKEVARGLITFLIAITTVGIALILAIAIISGNGISPDQFDRGKQVLTVLIGVLGTIVGFYFGSSGSQSGGAQPGRPKITTTILPDGSVDKAYSNTLQATGGTSPLKWSVTPNLPAGLMLNTDTGTLSGTPTTVSSKTVYTFTVTDSALPALSTTAALTLEVKPKTSA
jgi:hypothetical protein